MVDTHIEHKKEILEVIDRNENVVKLATRYEIHMHNLMHKELWILIQNDKKQLLLSKLAAHLLWDVSCGGHVKPKSTWIESSLRELKEELNIDTNPEELKELGIIFCDEADCNPTNNVKARCYLLKYNDGFQFSDNELIDAQWFDIKKIKEMIKDNPNELSIRLKKLFELFLKQQNK